MRLKDPASQPIAPVSTAVTAFVGRTRRGPLERPVHVNSQAEFAAIFGGLWNESPLSFAMQHFFENGGHTAIVARVGSHDATDSTPGGAIGDADLIPSGSSLLRRGLYLLDGQNFDLMVIPPFAWDRDPALATWATAAAYCRQRHAILLIDPPTGGTTAHWLTALATALPAASDAAQNAAVYVPRLVANNPLTRADQPFAPSGAIAGLMARDDTMSGVWESPAGTDLPIRGATGLERELDSAEISTHTQRGVNCLRTLPGSGTVVWGARTLQGADGLATEWKYLAVRRMALFLEKSIDAGTRWAAFEPNDEPLWSCIRLDAGEFLHRLFRQGAFQGLTPNEAYFVRCDASTTTQADIEQGIVNILIGFAPLRPAEFVIISIRQATQPPP